MFGELSTQERTPRSPLVYTKRRESLLSVFLFARAQSRNVSKGLRRSSSVNCASPKCLCFWLRVRGAIENATVTIAPPNLTHQNSLCLRFTYLLVYSFLFSFRGNELRRKFSKIATFWALALSLLRFGVRVGVELSLCCG